ncbi:MAG TPA: hypothetical protein PKY82_23485 [Pyrinomonadaceae bacterium]|nr:hypothetical protein [Pyrinomonadaceae bacterium]
MNVNYPKTISISLLKFALPLSVMLFLQVAANAQSYTQAEQNCFNQVQNKVAWNKAGEKVWGEANIRSLCKGTTNPTATISCFTNVINNYDDWNRGIRECSATAANNSAKNQPNKIEGETTYEPIPLTDAGSNSNKVVRDTNSTMQTISYTQAEQNCFDMVQNKVAYDQLGTKAWNEDNIRKLCKGTTDPTATISCFKNIISKYNDWNRGITECAASQTKVDDGMITRTITLKENSNFVKTNVGKIILISNYAKPENKEDIKTYSAATPAFGNFESRTLSWKSGLNEDVELWIVSQHDYKPFFKAIFPKNKDLTTFCYEISGTDYVQVVKTCDGTPTYEANYIAFKNESAFVADMRLTYYPLGGSTTKTASTEATLLGYSRKLYLPLDADTNRTMTFSVNMISGSDIARTLISKEVTLSDFDTVGSSCYKTWGAGMNPKASPCSLNPNARTIKFWNNSGYAASLKITYYDKDNAGNDVAKTINTNDIEVTQTDTIEVPQGTSLTPVKIEFRNSWNGYKTFSTMNASANFTGELCYKVEGTTFAPTAATCDDTVGDTSGKTRQIRFQNDAGYDAQMIVQFFVDEVINGQKMAMPKTLTTGMINGLGGKFRLVSIPTNTSKGLGISVVIQGNATIKGNDGIFATTLPEDFAASPQPCFKVWGTALNPSGGKCNQ